MRSQLASACVPHTVDGSGFITIEEAIYGRHIVLEFISDHALAKGLVYAFYAHLLGVWVREGEMVQEGALIGYTGMSGNARALPIDQALLPHDPRDGKEPWKPCGSRSFLFPSSSRNSKLSAEFDVQSAIGTIKQAQRAEIVRQRSPSVHAESPPLHPHSNHQAANRQKNRQLETRLLPA